MPNDGHRMRFSKKLVFSLILIFGGVAVSLAIGEVAARVRHHFGKKPEEAYLHRNCPNRMRRFGLRPGKKIMGYNDVEIHVNSLGFRGPEYSIEKKPGVRRILILGDSVAFGLRRPEDVIFPTVLEKLLNDGDGLNRYEVLNSAVSAYNSWNELGTLEDVGPLLRPDLVILQTSMNDFAPSTYISATGMGAVSLNCGDYLPEPTMVMAIEEFLEKHSMLAAQLMHWHDQRLREKGIRKDYFLFYKDFYQQLFVGKITEPKLEKAWNGALEAIEKMCRKTTELNARFLLVAFCEAYYLRYPEPPGGYSDQLRKIGRKHGFECLYMHDELPKRMGEGTRLFIDRAHLNSYGHLLVAEILRDHIFAHPELFSAKGEKRPAAGSTEPPPPAASPAR